MRKAQTQIVSAILVVVIALFGLSAILPWSINMIQKRKDTKSVDDVYNFFVLLDSKIRNVAENGGEERLTLNVPGTLTINPYSDIESSSDSNSIIFTFTSKVSNIATGDWIPLNTPDTNSPGILGISPAGVIFGKANKEGNDLKIQYKLWYRSLKDSSTNKQFRISIKTPGGQTITTNNGMLKIQRLRSYLHGESLTITEINIIV